MVSFPKAKINLGLTISDRRADGFHNIETIFYPVGFCDAMEIVESTDGMETDLLTITGLTLSSRNEDNLVLRAVRMLREVHPFPFLKIHLHKAIPAGAGLGGGSSDAACALCTLNKMFRLSLSTDDLRKIALSLGSDCPFFIESKPCFGTGRGEILTPVTPVLEGYRIVILNTGIQVSTKEAYDYCKPANSGANLYEEFSIPVTEWKTLLVNDFERTVFKKYPSIGILKERLYESGAIFSSMSGSGSSVYGIFREEPVIPDDLTKYAIYKGEI